MRAFFGVFLAFFTLIALFLRPLSNYYEAKYQKDFFITDERAMALSDKFINAAEDGLQSAKSAIDKLVGTFSDDKKQVATSAKTEQNLTALQTEPANLNAMVVRKPLKLQNEEVNNVYSFCTRIYKRY